MQYRTAVDALQLYKRVLTYYFVIGLTITACVGAFSPEVVTILARRPDYRQAGDIIPLIMLAQLLYGAVNIIDCGIAFSCRTMWYTYIYGGCVIVNIMLNVVLIPHWGAMGAAWAALGTFSLLVAVVFMVSNHFFRMEVEFGRLSRLFLGALVVLWLSQRLGSFSVVTVAAKCGLMVALLGFIGIWVLSTGERARLAGIVRSLALRAG
jgi:O-antigen/teichoic acid export membrane protein